MLKLRRHNELWHMGRFSGWGGCVRAVSRPVGSVVSIQIPLRYLRPPTVLQGATRSRRNAGELARRRHGGLSYVRRSRCSPSAVGKRGGARDAKSWTFSRVRDFAGAEVVCISCHQRLSPVRQSITIKTCGPARHDTGQLMYSLEPVRRVGEMELTFSCSNCSAVGHVLPLEGATVADCRHCGTARALRPEAVADGQLVACPWCMTTDLYIQKDFPQGLGLFIVCVGFAISTVFWYYEMPIPAYLVLIISILFDLVMYHLVGDVTICYRCLSQMRGTGTNPDGRYRPFDLASGERYRQERMRAEQLRERGAQPQ